MALSCLLVGFAINSSLPGVFAQSGDSFKIRADVDLVTVEVAALDKKGNPVRNLKKEDFQLYEDGKKQEILSIDEVNAAAEVSPSGVNPISGTTSHRGKTVLILFADNLIKPEDIQSSRDSAERFVQEHMRPQDLFAVAQFSMAMKILQNFTRDREAVLEAIRNAAGVSVSAMSGGLLQPALDRINYSLAQMKGQKSILIFADPVSYVFSLGDPRSMIPEMSPANPPTLAGVASDASGKITLSRIIPPKSSIVSNVVYYGVEMRAPGSNEKRIFDDLHFLNGTNDAELDKLDQKLSNYYILGFSSSSPKHDGAIRKLAVTTRLNAVTLKYRGATWTGALSMSWQTQSRKRLF